MNIRTRRTRDELVEAAIPIKEWPEPVLDDLHHSKLERYWRNRRAVEMYAAGKTGEEILKETKLRLKRVSEMFISGGSVNECLETANGFFVCVPGWRKPSLYRRRKPLPSNGGGGAKGLAGALGRLFEMFPSILKALLNLVHHRQHHDGYKSNVITTSLVHDAFVELCKKAGLTSRDYPLNTKHRGKSAIRVWLKYEQAKNPVAHADGVFGEAAKKDTSRAHNAANSKTKEPRELAYGRVQLDGHTHDSLWGVTVTIQGHTFRYKTELRPMLVVLKDQASTAKLAHTLTFKGQYSKLHLLRVLMNSFKPWVPKDLSRFDGSDFGYREGSGFPSMFPDFAWCRFWEIAWDRHTAQVALANQSYFRRVTGIHSVAMEGVGEGAARGDIEGDFGQIAKEAKQLLNATGSNPDDPARRAPEKAAAEYGMNQTLADIYFDVLFANSNGKPVRVGKLSPLDKLRSCFERGEFYENRFSEAEQKLLLWQLLPQHKARLNRAKKKTGPFYLELYSGARYSSLEISGDMNLLRYEGVDVTLYVEDDARYAHLVVPEPNGSGGRYIGRLEVQGRRWNYPHSLEERIWSDRLGREGLAEYQAKYKNPTLALNAFLVREAKSLENAAAIAADMDLKRQLFTKEVSRPPTDAERELSAEIDPDNDYEPDEQGSLVIVTEPIKPLNPGGGTGFGGRIL